MDQYVCSSSNFSPLNLILASTQVTRYIILDKYDNFQAYDPSTNEWRLAMKAPQWFNKGSSITAYQNGVIIVGTNNIADGRRVSALDFRNKSEIPLTDLPIALR